MSRKQTSTDQSRPSLEQLVVFLKTDRPRETQAFYSEVLGLPMVLDQGVCKIFQVSPAAFVGFCEHLESPHREGVILTLVSSEVDAWHERLVAAGVEIEKPPTKNETFDIYHCFIRDPNGYLVEIQEFLDPKWPSVT